LNPGDRYLLVASVLLMAGYAHYWFDGSYLGPRFLFPLAPVAVLWTARFPRTVSKALGSSQFRERWAEASLAMMILSGLALGVPARGRAHAQLYEVRRVNVRGLVEARSLENALILVPTTWEDQVNARMWALNIPRRDARLLSDGIDFCPLDLALSRLERSRVVGTAAVGALLPLVGDSVGPGSSVTLVGEATGLRTESSYPPVCLSRFSAERSGTFSFLPFRLQTGMSGNLFARDLHELNMKLLSRHPDRPVFLLRPGPSAGQARVEPLNVDSAKVEWERR
jgi:hypothetical protein